MSQVMNVGSEGRIISEVGLKHLRLQCAAEVGPVRFRALLDHLGSVEAVLSASRVELQRVGGIGPGVAESICTVRNDGSVDREVERAAAIGARIVCTEDADYPRPLLHISDPPICLYVRGHIEPADSVAVAIVGTRRCSHYGREQAVRFGGLLGRAGITVVSGLARGVDGSAHRGALDAGGRTIAVLGNGLGEIYPPEHADLAEDVVRAGALVSELPVDTVPDFKNFPRRNRIIAGLSLGVLVVEAGKRSGALITARLASEYNREVFAVPGRVDRPEHTAGVHAMIRKGHAKLVTCLDDVLDELDEVGAILREEEDDAAASPSELLPGVDRLGPDERAILEAVTAGAEDIESAAVSTGLNAGRVAGAVTSLQLKGFLERHPGNRLTCRRVGS